MRKVQKIGLENITLDSGKPGRKTTVTGHGDFTPMSMAEAVLQCWGSRLARGHREQVAFNITWANKCRYGGVFSLARGGINGKGESLGQFITRNLNEWAGRTTGGRNVPKDMYHSWINMRMVQAHKRRAALMLDTMGQ